MQITVLGKSPAWQDADGACSGYLVEEDGACLLLDCGNGVFSKLRRFRDYTDIDAVVISHLHADHFLDLVPFAYALTYAPRQQPVPVDRWPGTDSPARPRALRAARRARDVPPRSSARGAARTSSRRRSSSIEYDPRRDARRRDAADRASTRCRTSRRRSRSTISSTNGGGRFTYGADSAPERGARARSPTARTCSSSRRRCRARSARARAGTSRQPRPATHGARAPASGASSSPTSPTSSTSCGRAREAEQAFGGPVLRRPRGRRLHGLTASRRALSGCPAYSPSHASRARPVRELRAHAPRDGRAVRRRLRPHRPGAAPSAAASPPPSTSSTRATRRARSCRPSWPASTRTS